MSRSWEKSRDVTLPGGKPVVGPYVGRIFEKMSETLIPVRHKRRYRYRATYQKVDLGYSFDTMVASRGCPYNCKFCSFKRNPLGQKRPYSERTPESVVAELKGIDARLIAFLDDNFFVNPKRAERICDLIIREKLNKIFIVNARINIAFGRSLTRPDCSPVNALRTSRSTSRTLSRPANARLATFLRSSSVGNANIALAWPIAKSPPANICFICSGKSSSLM